MNMSETDIRSHYLVWPSAATDPGHRSRWLYRHARVSAPANAWRYGGRLDNLNDYYDVSLKEARLKLLIEKINSLLRDSTCDRLGWRSCSPEHFDVVINLAAQAGVRYSLINPHAYVEATWSGSQYP